MLYFASDFHLGIPNRTESLEREKKVVRWLESIAANATEIFLVGDVFDFWFEYKTAVPKGYTRLLGCLARLTDSGITVRFFAGNHDMWLGNYLEQETGLELHTDEYRFAHCEKTFFVAHGDGLGPGDRRYKLLKKIFRNPACRWMFRQLHPDIGMRMATYFSRRSRNQQGHEVPPFMGNSQEWLVQFCMDYLSQTDEPVDFFIFGHRHLPLDISLEPYPSRYINLGDWFGPCSYAVFDGTRLHLRYFEHEYAQQ